MRKTEFDLCENKGANQLCSNCKADQRLCFRFKDGILSIFLKSKILSFLLSSVNAQTVLSKTWSSTPKIGFWLRGSYHVMLSGYDGGNPSHSFSSQFSCVDVRYVREMSRLVGKPTMWFPNKSYTNQAVQSQKQARSLKFWR